MSPPTLREGAPMIVDYVTRYGGGLRRTFEDSVRPYPVTNQFRARDAYHILLRSFYANTIYEDAAIWKTYKARYRLPRAIRSIYNPTRRAVDFYAGAVYPGTWSEDGQPTSTGRPPAIRFTPDSLTAHNDAVLAAIQALDWGEWNANKDVYVREGAKLGSVFVEVIDDLDRRKVYPEIVPLEHLDRLELDASGNVERYAVEYMAVDDDGKSFLFRKEVDEDLIAIFHDNGKISEDDNLYGFAPAVWVRHRHNGTTFGSPAIDGVIPKIDEANRLATGMHNYIGQLQKQPAVFFSKASPVPLSQALGKNAQKTSSELDAATLDEQVMWLWSNDKDGRVANFMTEIGIGDAGLRLDKLLEEIENDLPEVNVSKDMRQMQLVTGPGAERIIGDVAGKLYESEANYDAGTIKLMQMCVTIGGWRLNRGDWGAVITRQQEKFRPFDLPSYEDGDVDLTLSERALFEPTELERVNVLTIKKAVANLPDEVVQHELGYSPDDIAKMAASHAANQQLQAATAPGQF